MGSIEKPGNSLTMEGRYCAAASSNNADKTAEFLAVSAVVFNWADSYDAKVHWVSLEASLLLTSKKGLATTAQNCCAHALGSYSFQLSLLLMLVRDTDTSTYI
jgi:hypothetical protein